MCGTSTVGKTQNDLGFKEAVVKKMETLQKLSRVKKVQHWNEQQQPHRQFRGEQIPIKKQLKSLHFKFRNNVLQNK